MKNEYLNNKFFEKVINQFQDSKREKEKLEIIIDDINLTISRKKKRKVKFEENKIDLINKKNLYNQVHQDYLESKEKLAIAFFTLAENIVRYAKFKMIDVDDATQEGIMICFEKINIFDSRKGKAFNYMTTCILNHFRQLYRSAKNYNELKKRYLKHVQFNQSKIIIKNGKQIIY